MEKPHFLNAMPLRWLKRPPGWWRLPKHPNKREKTKHVVPDPAKMKNLRGNQSRHLARLTRPAPYLYRLNRLFCRCVVIRKI